MLNLRFFNRQIFCASPEGKTEYLLAKSPELAFRTLMVICWIIQKNKKRALLNNFWACYHSNLYTCEVNGLTVGIIPRAVGASYAVLIAEQLFVSGCELLISITSAGIISDLTLDEKFTLITEAIRDEGTSYHYIRKHETSKLCPTLYKQFKTISAFGASQKAGQQMLPTEKPNLQYNP